MSIEEYFQKEATVDVTRFPGHWLAINTLDDAVLSHTATQIPGFLTHKCVRFLVNSGGHLFIRGYFERMAFDFIDLCFEEFEEEDKEVARRAREEYSGAGLGLDVEEER